MRILCNHLDERRRDDIINDIIDDIIVSIIMLPGGNQMRIKRLRRREPPGAEEGYYQGYHSRGGRDRCAEPSMWVAMWSKNADSAVLCPVQSDPV